MKNGRIYKIDVKRIIALLCSILYMLGMLASLVSCRSSRKTVEGAYRDAHAAVREVSTVDTIQYSAGTCKNSKDSAELHADECTVIQIKRDSVGRIIEIASARTKKVSANVSSKTDIDREFYGINATQSSEASKSAHSITEKKEETTKTVNAGKQLECVIVWSVIIILILCYTSTYIYKVWKRIQGK